MSVKGLVERLKDGENIIIAEGYMWEFERRGFLKAGGFIPEVVLEHPERVKSMHEEFVFAGSDVVEAFQYYGHREKLRTIGREDDLEKLNRTALKVAKEVAVATGTLMTGGLCNTGLYSTDAKSIEAVKEMFKEQVEWCVEEGADYIIGETFNDLGEAQLALEAIQKYGKGVPAVIMLTAYVPDRTTDEVPIPEACRRLEEAGAAVVGLNCGRGPRTMLPLLKEIRKACKGPIAAVPVPFRTSEECKSFQSLKDPETGTWIYPNDLECISCNRNDIRDFAEAAKAIGVNYIGLCCGNSPAFTRELARSFGRTPSSMRYYPDTSMSFVFGDKKQHYNQSAKIRQFMIGEQQ